jgi:hypothetical protein
MHHQVAAAAVVVVAAHTHGYVQLAVRARSFRLMLDSQA